MITHNFRIWDTKRCKRFHPTHRQLQSWVDLQPHSFLELSFSKMLLVIALWHSPWRLTDTKDCSKLLLYPFATSALCVQQCLLLHFTNEKVMSRVFPTTWPSYSPELNRCDFRLRGHFKRSGLGCLVTLADLKEGISEGICEKNLSRPDIIRSWGSYPQTADFTPSRREQYWAVFPSVDKILVTRILGTFK